jgi:hypothetical protein
VPILHAKQHGTRGARHRRRRATPRRRAGLRAARPVARRELHPTGTRFIVRREWLHPGADLTLFDTIEGIRHQVMATDTPPGHGSTQYLEARHRVHATAARLRRRPYVVAAMVGSLNYAHFAGPRLVPTAAAVGFGIPPDQPRAALQVTGRRSARWSRVTPGPWWPNCSTAGRAGAGVAGGADVPRCPCCNSRSRRRLNRHTRWLRAFAGGLQPLGTGAVSPPFRGPVQSAHTVQAPIQQRADLLEHLERVATLQLSPLHLVLMRPGTPLKEQSEQSAEHGGQADAVRQQDQLLRHPGLPTARSVEMRLDSESAFDLASLRPSPKLTPLDLMRGWRGSTRALVMLPDLRALLLITDRPITAEDVLPLTELPKLN